MNMVYNQSSMVLTINNQHTFTNGGYIGYFKLVFLNNNSLFSQLLNICNQLKFTQKVSLIFNFIMKTPWWILIKPLGVMFSKTIKYEGKFKILKKEKLENNHIVDDNRINYLFWKKTTFKFLFIPIFSFWTRKLNNNEIENLTDLNIENYQIVKFSNTKKFKNLF